MSKKLLIIGAGGHGKVLADTVLENSIYSLSGFADSTVPVGTSVIAAHKVITNLNKPEEWNSMAEYFIVAIGNNKIRSEWYEKAAKFLKPANIFHPSAVVSKFAKIGEGTVILARSVVNSGTVIGKNGIINSMVLVDHECVIGDHVHIAQGTIVGSNCIIGDLFVSKLGEKIESNSKRT